MASYYVHLAIAKKYMEKNKGKIKSARDFYDGNILPDLVADKTLTHYGIRTEQHDMIKHLREKVNLQKFLFHNEINGDRDLGRLLHMYVDYEYYSNFLIEKNAEYLRRVDRFSLSCDHSYTMIHHEENLSERYNVSFNLVSFARELEAQIPEWRAEFTRLAGVDYKGKLLFNKADLDVFIERLSSANLEELVEKFRS